MYVFKEILTSCASNHAFAFHIICNVSSGRRDQAYANSRWHCKVITVQRALEHEGERNCESLSTLQIAFIMNLAVGFE